MQQSWPDTVPTPVKTTLWKWLRRDETEQRVLKQGRGSKRKPFKYYLPGMIEKWQTTFIANFTRQLERNAARAGSAPFPSEPPA
jgi:hypothetical protein